MSPSNKKKLFLLRKKLDLIDNKMLNLLKIRTNYVKRVLSLKEFKKEIIDKKRINKILRIIKVKSIKKGVDPKISNRVWKNMIYAFIDYEFRNFKKKINNYLLCGGNFFSINISCFLVTGLYFLAFNLTFAFSPPDGFLT